jgi:hypothetical protein
MGYIAYVIGLLIGILLSWVSFTFVRIGGEILGYIFGVCLVGAHIWAFIFSGKKANQGDYGTACAILISPMFIVTGIFSIVEVVKSVGLSISSMSSTAYTDECKTAGVQYIKLPSQPAHSIAYEWDQLARPEFDYYEITSLGFSAASRNPPYSSSIVFTEYGLSTKYNLKHNQMSSYTHKEREGEGYKSDRVKKISADILVNYRIREIDNSNDITSYDLIVSDRRDGVKLARLKYVIDRRERRFCGFTSENKINEREFILKAIGLQVSS